MRAVFMGTPSFVTPILEALNSDNHVDLVAARIGAYDFDGCAKAGRNVRQLSPRFPLQTLVLCTALSGDMASATLLADEWHARELDQGESTELAVISKAWLAAHAGNRELALQLLSTVEPRWQNKTMASAVFAQLGDLDRTFEMIEEVYSGLPTHLRHLRSREAIWGEAVDDPRWAEWIHRLGLDGSTIDETMSTN